MTTTIKQQAFKAFDLLTDKEQALIFELIQSLAPDDIATPDDVAAHTAATIAHQRGETVWMEDIDWT
jgi:hypothetical protein